MDRIDVSVVMSVYNNVDTVRGAVESILSQEAVGLELIVIDDGSTDGSGKILDDIATADSRLKVVHKKNEGLTVALLEGCRLASSPWIARQDADDFSLPGRLCAQLKRASQSDAPVLITCGAMWTTEDGVDLFPSLASDDSKKLKSRLLDDGKSICAHGTAFFSKNAYELAGGYRPEFYFAQDLDLFSRLARIGELASVQGIFYRYTFSPHSISSHSADSQKKFSELILRSDNQALSEAMNLCSQIREGKTRRETPFAGYYFTGCCLRCKDPKTAMRYFRKALTYRPWSLRALFRFLQCVSASLCGRIKLDVLCRSLLSRIYSSKCSF